MTAPVDLEAALTAARERVSKQSWYWREACCVHQDDEAALDDLVLLARAMGAAEHHCGRAEAEAERLARRILTDAP